MASASNVSFGALLRRLRINGGLTQEALAEASGVGVRTISDLERGLADHPRSATLAQLIAALQLTPEAQAALEAAARRFRQAATPIANSHLGAPQTALSGRDALAPLLVGRDAELAAIERLLVGEYPPALFLAGEPGIGKTRMLAEVAVRAQAHGWEPLAGGCTRRSGQEPYAPLLDAFSRRLMALSASELRVALEGCAWLVRLLPELAERAIAPAPAWELPPAQERRLMYAAVKRFLANIAGPAGTLLLLDDMQWSGEDAIDLLAELMRAAPEQSLRVVVAYRVTEVTANHPLGAFLADLARERLAEPLPLSPLTSEAGRRLLASLLDETSEPDRERLTEQLLERSGGVPYFLVSCAQMVAGQVDGAELPWTVRQSIRQRVAALPETAQGFLGLAAIGGRELRRAPLFASAEKALKVDRATLLVTIELVCQAGLFKEDEQGCYLFTHDLIREAVLADLSAGRRVEWRLAWAEALERLPEREWRPAEVAWHFQEAGEAERALPYAFQAGDRAKKANAHAQAEEYYRMAARLARQAGDASSEADALERLGEVLYNLGRIKDTLATLESAAALRKEIGDLDQYAWDTAYIIRADISLGQAERGIARLQAMLEALSRLDERKASESVRRTKYSQLSRPPSSDDQETLAASVTALLSLRTAARVYLSLTAGLCALERFEEAVWMGERAVESARSAGEDWIQTRAQRFLGEALIQTGQVSRAVAAAEDGGAVADRTQDLEGIILNYGSLGRIYQQRGDLAHALPHLLHVFETAERFEVPEFILQTACGLAEASYISGRWDQARVYCERALEAVRTSDVTGDSACPMLIHATLSLAQGELQQAQAYLDEVIVLSESGGNLPMFRAARGAPAERELLDGDFHAGYARLKALHDQNSVSEGDGQITVAVDLHAMLSLLAWAEADLGDLDTAEVTLSNCIARATAQEQYLVLIDALRVRAMLAMRRGQWEEAQRALDEALLRSRETPYPYAEAKALYVYGLLDVAMSQPAHARERYSQSLVILNQLGERLYAPHVAQALEAVDV
jgi:tetratricopeptide (TPR) repeat protein